MIYDNSYYEDEVRDGFYVPSIMKRAWAAQLEVLEVVADICKRHNIQWFAEWGTMLGAVRHQGFTPWDDDLDIGMKRHDYMKFIQVAKDELPQGYELVNLHDEKHFYPQFLSRVNNTRHVMDTSPEFMKKHHGFPYVCGMDIFVLDYLPVNKEDEQFQFDAIYTVVSVADGIGKDGRNLGIFESQLKQIEEMFGIKVDRAGNVKQQLYVLAEQLCSLYTQEEAMEITQIPQCIEDNQYRFPKEYYEQTILLPFESMEIPVPLYYDAILTKKYGNYMVPYKSGSAHEYPFWDRTNKKYEEEIAWFVNRYVCPKETLTQIAQKQCLNQVKEHKCVVFLPFKDVYWTAMESVWKQAVADGCDVYVVPLPYYEKNYDGSVGAMHYDVTGYPQYVPWIRYDAIDLEQLQPDVIYIQNPYDGYNRAVTLPLEYYSSNLRKLTKQLIYIPYFYLEEFEAGQERAVRNMLYYCTLPGLVYADKVVVQSENMRQRYIEVLSDWAGEETKHIWEQKIIGTGSPKMEFLQNLTKEQLGIPDEWLPILQKEDGSYRKIILYNLNQCAVVQHGPRLLPKIEEVLQIFYERREEVALIWRPHYEDGDRVMDVCPGLWNAYEEKITKYLQEGWGICDLSKNENRAMLLCDAYYGDQNTVANQCKLMGKPVLIQNVNVCDTSEMIKPEEAVVRQSAKKQVVFLPYKASMWDSLESVWKKMKENPEYDVYVIPIPYFDRNADGTLGQMHYEGEDYPSYVPITSYEEYDLEQRHPEAIFIHNPYDEYNQVTTIHPFFYSSRIKNFTNELVYIPYFVLDEVNPDDRDAVQGIAHFCTVPGVVHAHKVIVQSESMRQVYINVMTEFAGENTRGYWENKILGTGSPKIDKIMNLSKEGFELPEEWNRHLYKADGTRKKVILYNTGVTALLRQNQQMLLKIKDVMEVFRQNYEDVILLWRPHPLLRSTIAGMRPHLLQVYDEIVREYQEEDFGIYDDTADMDRAIAFSDAYYGDESSLVVLYKLTGKPVMIQNAGIISEMN